MNKKTLTIENKIEQLSLLAEFVEELCEEMELGMEMVFNLNLALEEAMTNVIMYAYPQDEVHTITLTAKREGDKLAFLLEDTGIAFDPTEVPDADTTLSAEERSIGGLGIFLIRQIMNEVSYQRIDGKNMLTMVKKI